MFFYAFFLCFMSFYALFYMKETSFVYQGKRGFVL